MSHLVFQALRALGPGATKRECGLVAAALRATGDREVEALCGADPRSDGWERLMGLAEEAGSNGLVALDLATEFQSPGCLAGIEQDAHVDVGVGEDHDEGGGIRWGG
jgi:hypothetical protein